jgi:hypothetical protein
MPRDVQFAVPFPFRVNAHLAIARERNVQWARELGALGSDEATERYRLSQVTDLAAHFYPDAGEEDLALAFDLMGWFFLFDDEFAVPAGQHPAAAVTDCQSMILQIITSPGPGASPAPTPIVLAFADIWSRMAKGMSPLWRARTTGAFLEYLFGNLTEVADLRSGTNLSPTAYFELRRKTIGVPVSLAMGERFWHREVPALAWSSSHLEQMRLITTDHIICVNEVISLEKEEAAGEPNLILKLMQHHDLTRSQATAKIVARADTAAERFRDLQRQIPHLCDTLALTTAERSAVRHYADLMSTLIRGNYDWSQTAGRYAPGAEPLSTHLE